MNRLPFLAFAIGGAVLAAFGQVSFKQGADGRVLPHEFLNGWIMLGALLYVAGTVLWIAALSRVPLVAVYPFTALTFVLVNVLALLVLGERVPPLGLVGIVLVLAGLFLVVTSLENHHGAP